ncbi:MAG: pyridoxal-dependent decarboxylase [Bacteroidota bacterium]
MEHFDFAPETRRQSLAFLLPKLEAFFAQTASLPVSKAWDREKIKQHARSFSLKSSQKPEAVLEQILTGLTEQAIHSPHPGYLGLFNPRANFASALAELISGVFNPQLAAWGHAPFANEIEQYLIEEFGVRFGYMREQTDGTFCSGGAESNLTAVLAALNHRFPAFHAKGLTSVNQPLRMYVSVESHHSIVKAAKVTGLGSEVVREIPVTATLQMDTEQLEAAILLDMESGFCPLMLVGTSGTTGAGAMDNLVELGKIARKYGMWFHVDAAYGGASILSNRTQRAFRGIEQSDSITLDAHKWFSTGMGASLFLTSHPGILQQSFRIQTGYMPPREQEHAPIDPYEHSLQWSRRFIGLKLYLPLAIHGWKGYRQVIERQMDLGDYLRNRIRNAGWEILNFTKLPVICFTHAAFPDEISVRRLVEKLNRTGQFWVSAYPVRGRWGIRVCISNYNTDESLLREFLDQLTRNIQQVAPVSHPH